MRKPIALILGATGGIGGATRSAFLDAGYRVIPVGSSMMNFDQSNSEDTLFELLKSSEADVVVNSVGVFVNGTQDTHHKIFNINFGSNWSIIRYYHSTKDNSKPVKIIMVGSSSYDGGRVKYPLYSASKAALYNLWESSVDLFQGTDISVDLINPMRTKTKMNAGHYNPELPYHSPTEVANEILKLASRDGSSCLNMTLESAK
jgi:short-subunit dehydrogenase